MLKKIIWTVVSIAIPVGIAVYLFTTHNHPSFDKVKFAQTHLPKVVLVSVEASKPEYEATAAQTGATGSGTGFWVHQDETHGWLLTNYHVIRSYTNLKEYLTIRAYTINRPWTYTAELVNFDTMTDLALLKIEKLDNENWTPVTLNTSKNLLEGMEVLSIGHGATLPWSVNYGHIVSTDRFSIMPLNFMLQHDAVINVGNSGGPVFDMNGDVIGINTVIISPGSTGRKIGGWNGIAMAVNSWQADRVLKKMMNNEKVKYIEFDFKIRTLDVADIDKVDTFVESFLQRSYAEVYSQDDEDSNIKNGDIIFEADGEKVWTMLHFVKAIIDNDPGDIIKVRILRDGMFMEVEYQLREYTPPVVRGKGR